MALTLDPRFPIVWRSPESLQVGIDPPRVIIEPVSAAHEQIVSALASSVSASGVDMIGRAGGLAGDELSRILELLSPAFVVSDEPPPRRVAIAGTGTTARKIGEHLTAAGLQVNGEADPDIAVVVGHFVIEPEQHGRWLRRDVPHLPVVWSDRTARVGPMVVPGASACLYCVELHAADADPAWPAVASQLLGRSSRAETPLASAEVAALVSRVVMEWLDTGETDGAGLELDVATGRTRAFAVPPHPGCGCGTLDVTTVRPEIAMVSEPRPGPRPSSPTRGQDDDAPA